MAPAIASPGLPTPPAIAPAISFFFAASKFDDVKIIKINIIKIFTTNDTVLNLTEPG